MPRTIVFFHAHPDDEALLTAGTMARCATAGHRVVLVVATSGGAGLASAEHHAGDGLAARRTAELHRSAQVLGVARTELLGYADSGLHGEAPSPPGRATFVRAPVEEAAERLAGVLREEGADVLTTYDPAGGYGHPDHVRVHHVGARAAQLAGTPVVLEATIDRDLVRPLVGGLRALRLVPAGLDRAYASAYSPRAEITHRVDVTAHLGAKRAALAAHASQASGGVRTLGALLALPPPLFRRVAGREWYVHRGVTVTTPPRDDVFATVPG